MFWWVWFDYNILGWACDSLYGSRRVGSTSDSQVRVLSITPIFASSPKSLHLDILTSVLLTSMEMDGVVFDSHSAGQQAAMDVDTHLGIEKKTRKKGLKRKQSDAPLVRCIGVLLDGTKFDCSVDRGYSSNLEIGQGQLVIKEGDEGIKTILNASPPNATLQIGVECLSWSSAEDNCKDGSMLKDVATEREKCKENLKELAKFEASPEDGTYLVSKSERLDFTVNDGKFFEAAKKMKKGEVVVLTAKSQDGFPKLASDGEGDVPLDATPSTLELVSWKTFADATDDNNKIVKGGEVCESPNDGTVEEEDDSDYDFDSHHLYGCATAEEGERMRYESYKRYKEGCRRIAEHEKEAKKAWKRDFGSWFSLYLDGKVSGNWRDSYRIDEDGFVATYRARAPPEALDGLGFSDLDEWDGDDI